MTSLVSFRRKRTDRAGQAGAVADLAALGQAPVRPARAYLNGMLSNLLNPKISVFFMAFLPAFVPAGASTSQFSLALGAWFIAETGLWLAVVAWLADRGVRWLRRPTVQRWLERITGIVLIGFGLRLATESRRFA